MTDTDIIDRLHRELGDHHLTHPVDAILDRGRVLRTRRRRPYALAAVVVVGAGAIGAVAVVRGASPAFADWSATPEVAPADVVAAIDRSCRAGLGQPTGTTLALVDRRGSNAVAVYTSTTGDYQCTRFRGSGHADDAAQWSQGGSGGPSVAVNTGSTFDVVDISSGTNVHEGSMTAISGRVQSTVTRVTVSVSGRTIEGAVGGGAFDVWWPAVGAEPTTVDLTAYAADGTQVGTLDLTVAGFGRG